MSVSNFIKKELSGWNKWEKILFPLEIFIIILISLYMKDSRVALISAICGICATIFAGKGKISCFAFGIIANICYSYISYKNSFWGNLGLNILYYLPMQFVGICHWKKHLKMDTQEIYKTQLTNKERILYTILVLGVSLIGYSILLRFNDSSPIMDSLTTVLSIFAYILTVKRCIEQWYVWTVVNGLCTFMWIGAYLNGSNCFATILMWATYLILGIYFMYTWKKEVK